MESLTNIENLLSLILLCNLITLLKPLLVSMRNSVKKGVDL